MNNRNFLSKIAKREFRLTKILADRVDNIPKNTNVKINQEVTCEVLERNKDGFTAKVNVKVFIDPEDLFSMEIEHEMRVVFNEEVADEEIDNYINDIIAALGPEVSYIIASITKKMFGTHMILPPVIKVEKIEEDK